MNIFEQGSDSEPRYRALSSEASDLHRYFEDTATHSANAASLREPIAVYRRREVARHFAPSSEALQPLGELLQAGLVTIRRGPLATEVFLTPGESDEELLDPVTLAEECTPALEPD